MAKAVHNKAADTYKFTDRYLQDATREKSLYTLSHSTLSSVMFSLEQKTFCIHIPQEIYDLIIHQAKTDRSTLYNLCLVSSSFLPQAQRTLYHDLNISTDGYSLCSGWRINATQAMSLFRTLTELNPALAKYVQSLYHRLLSCHGFVERLYWNRFQQTLRLLSNLKRLTITCINPIPDLYTGCSFRLEVFGSDRACDEPVMHDATLQHLAAQPDLRSLYAWRFCRSEEHLPATYCPNLEALTGDRRTIESILPGRSVTRLTWIPDSGEDISSPPQSIAVELSNIRILSLGGYFKRLCLRQVIPYLPSLEVLRLFGETREVRCHFFLWHCDAMAFTTSISSIFSTN